MKQSSIEWLFEKLFDSFEKFNNGEITFSDYLAINLELRNQAKEMHKQEVIEAHAVGRIKECSGINTDGYHYFDETFKTESNGK